MKNNFVSLLKEIVQDAEIWNEGEEIQLPSILDMHSELYIYQFQLFYLVNDLQVFVLWPCWCWKCQKNP